VREHVKGKKFRLNKKVKIAVQEQYHHPPNNVKVEYKNVRSEGLTAVRMTMLFIWILMLCRLIGRCQHFGETYCLHLQG
jgi:hypothetical protein